MASNKDAPKMEEILKAYGSVFNVNAQRVKVDETEETDEDFEKRFTYYIENFCVHNNVKPSLEGFCAYCGIGVAEYKRWKNGSVSVSERRRFAIREIDAILLACLNEFASAGQVNYAYAIFVLKNDFGYEDKQEHIVAPSKKLLQKQKSNAEIEKILEANSGGDIFVNGIESKQAKGGGKNVK